MKVVSKPKQLAICALLLGWLISGLGIPQVHALSSGDTAPAFSLQDLRGKKFQSSTLKGKPLSIIYFFAPASKASISGMELLLGIRQRHPDWDVNIVAVSEGSKGQTARWAERQAGGLVVLLDDGHVASLYQVGQVLPVSYLIGPDLVILNKVSGGGKSGHKLLVRLAERELSRKRVTVAASLAEEAVKAAPRDPEAKAVLGYAALKQGKIDEAEEVFTEISSYPDSQVIGKEGLAHVRLEQGKSGDALTLAEEASGRAGADTLRGDILYARGKTRQAQKVYQQASAEPAFAFHRSRPLNRLGKLAAARKNYPEAIRYYDRALEVDPLAVEVLSNKGVVLGKEGKWDVAARTYQEVLKLSPQDQIAMGLLRQAQEMLDLAKDAQKAERIDRLIKELSERYRKGRFRARTRDDWTSRPLILAFLPLTEGGFPMDREGVTQVLSLEVGQRLESTGRVRIVERVLLDKLLAELNLGSSDLADPGTALRLGKVLAAKLLAAGYLRNGPNAAHLSLRLIDSETSAVPAVISTTFDVDRLDQEADKVAQSLMDKVREQYPLRGYIVKAKGEQVILNLGREQGLRPGTHMAILVEGKTIEFMGRKLKGDLEQVGHIEVLKVEKDLSYGRVLAASGKVKKGMKVEEIIDKKVKNL